MNPQHQRINSTGGSYPPQMSPTGSSYYHHDHPQNQSHQPIIQQQQPMYPVLPSMNHPPPPLRHHHDPSFSQHPPMQQAHVHLLQSYWVRQMHEIQNVPQDFKVHHLPLARIKKVMKTDDDVKAKMISADAPMIFDKGCDIFITELTLRAWIHAEENKRRTLQRSDIAAAIAKTDMFDFLIDIVPRDECKISIPKEHKSHHSLVGSDRRRSQEMFQPMPGPGSATGPKGPSGAGGVGSSVDASLGLEGYYPYAVLDNSTFGLGQDPQLQMQYLSQQQQQQQQQPHSQTQPQSQPQQRYNQPNF
ncbi:hypothetical protein BGZ46_005305 [Entomortierella lignicola]|nr:hypothetical protein BGZ46_005305 [Entomortierella lignicola]